MNPIELLRAGPPIKNGAILGFLSVRNEALRLPAMLNHHRRLGVDQFVIVDNDSDDGTRDLLAAMPDVQLYSAPGSYAAAGFGHGWLHPLLDALADNHWALTLDADELFVYPHCERLTLPQLCRFLDREGSDSVFTILLDMYSQSNIAATVYRQGEALLDACTFFDPGPYTIVRGPLFPTFELRGGPRARAFWTPTTPFFPPTVSKVPARLSVCEFNALHAPCTSASKQCNRRATPFQVPQRFSPEGEERSCTWRAVHENTSFICKLSKTDQIFRSTSLDRFVIRNAANWFRSNSAGH